jgi:hypothetical protein
MAGRKRNIQGAEICFWDQQQEIHSVGSGGERDIQTARRYHKRIFFFEKGKWTKNEGVNKVQVNMCAHEMEIKILIILKKKL